jgi:hypothetical protein
LQPLLFNLKGIVFISGPHQGSLALQTSQASAAPYIGLLLRFDPVGELAIDPAEANDYLFATSYVSKTTYSVAKRNKQRLRRLQADFEYMSNV